MVKFFQKCVQGNTGGNGYIQGMLHAKLGDLYSLINIRKYRITDAGNFISQYKTDLIRRRLVFMNHPALEGLLKPDDGVPLFMEQPG